MKKLLTLIFALYTISSYAQKQTYRIGVLADNRTERVEPALDELQRQIIAVVGEDAKIVFPPDAVLINYFDANKAAENYQQFVDGEIDIILAFGALNSHIISKQTDHAKPTILFGAVNQDFNGIDLSKATSGIENFTYLIESESFLEDYKIFQELTNFKTLGIVIERAMVDILPLKDIFDKEFQGQETTYKLIPFDTASDITNNLDGIDAVYMAGGFFLTDNEIRNLANAFIEKGLPSFTSLGRDQVMNGIMGTNQSDENFDQFIRRIALSVEGYVTGTPLSEMPVFIDYSPRLTLNYNTAEAVNVPIKYSLIAQTDFVGDMVNVLSNKTYNLLEVIDGVLEENLGLQSEQKNVDLQSQELKTAKSNYLPSITASGQGTYIDPNLAEISNGQNPEFSTSGNITLQQTVFSEAANANITIQDKLQKAQQEDFNAAQLDAIFDAVNAYFNVLILKANAQIQLRNLNLTKRNLAIAKQNFEAGESGKSDMLRFRSQMAQNTQAMVEAVNQLEQSFVILNQLLNNPVDTEIDVEDVELDEGVFSEYNYDKLANLLDDPTSREPFIAFLIEEAKQNAPELKALGYNLEAIERSYRLNSAGRFLPTVALQGQYNRTFNRSGAGSEPAPGFTLLDDNYNVGLNVSIPILNQNQTNINRQTTLIQQDQLNINMENFELAIASNMRTAILNVINDMSNIALSKISEETAQEALDLTQTSYANGAVNIIQLIDAQNNYLDAQLQRTTAAYNFLIDALQVERILGYYFLLNSQEENNQFNQRFLEYLNTRN